jgi:hypothetical protein
MPDPEDYHPLAVSRAVFADSLDQSIAQEIVDRLEDSDAPLRAAQLRVLGGAVARVPESATAYPHRARRIMAVAAAFYEGPEDRPRRLAWASELAEVMRQGESGVYVNFLGDEGEPRVREAYGEASWQRLVRVKRQYDPSNLFRLNQNIPPDARIR